MSMELFAHSPGEEQPDEWQSLSDHLWQVADQAGEFAQEFGSGQWGYCLGILHDAGKAAKEFQDRLHGSGEAVDHASPGAALAEHLYTSKQLKSLAADVLALAIAGHHGGIPNYSAHDRGGCRPLRERLLTIDVSVDDIESRLAELDITLPDVEDLEPMPAVARLMSALQCGRSVAGLDKSLSFSFSVFCRMLFSCLVDADYLDTERFLTPSVYETRYALRRDSLKILAGRLDAHMDALAARSPDTPVNRARASVRTDCLSAAALAPGLFTLTVPTGGGKTLASLDFALHHALLHRKRRVIYGIPYTSIVGQTAEVFRSVLGENNVLEHHSNYDFEAAEGERGRNERLAVQNWNAPVIVTTNVQLFESLFSNKPGKCRKLHNIANSVIVLDEAQTLPDELLTATLAMLQELCIQYGVTVVLCTATQPALDVVWPFDPRPVEIISNRNGFEEAFGGRTSFNVLGDLDEDKLVDKLAAHEQVLCIVGTKPKARRLYEHLVERSGCEEDAFGERPYHQGIFHLSANMTPAHRAMMLSEMRRRLDEGARCQVISTQLIEAGVDVDFPVVYRELAGMDSLYQAAGRCNREGSANEGIVYIFELNEHTDDGRPKALGRTWLERMKGISRELLHMSGGVFDDGMVKRFFERRYDGADLDARGVFDLLTQPVHQYGSLETLCMERVAREYRIIDDSGISVFVPWGETGIELMYRLRESVEHGVPPAALASSLQRCSVCVRTDLYDRLVRDGAVDQTTYAPIKVLLDDGCRTYYSDEVGLLEPGEEVLQSLLL